MTEGAIKPDIEEYSKSEPGYTTGENISSFEETRQIEAPISPPKIIWTPRFIMLFSLTLIVGLTIECVLTRGWLNSSYTGQWVFLVHVILVCICWFGLLAVTHSNWMRIGSIFGCIWTIFITLNILVSTQHGNLASHLLSLLNAATCIALLGSYICLSINNSSFNRWDAWFFSLAPIAGSITVTLVYFLTPGDERSLNTLENSLATVALVLSILIWWMRPTSWKSQPGPTFLFGCVPLIFLSLTATNMEFNPANYFLAHVLMSPVPNSLTNETNFFLSQVALLCLILGLMRVLQGEHVTKRKYDRTRGPFVSKDTLNL
jgi:hypothetical protein